MGRLAPVAVSLLALALVFLLPEVPRAKLAALQAHQLLEQPVGPAPPAGVEDVRPTLGALVLRGPAAEHAPDGSVRLRLYGVQLAAEAEAQATILHHIETRRSLVRGMRQAAGAEGLELTIEGEDSPAVGGATFYVQLIGEELLARYLVDESDLEPVVVTMRWHAPDRTSLLPPLIAVALAVLLRRPILALVCGVLAGAILAQHAGAEGWGQAAVEGVRAFGAHYFWNQAVDPERAMIMAFVLFMLAMVGVMTRAGGIRGLMDSIALRARTARRTQVATWLMGLAVFFDDYANTLLVGSTMRPLTDRFRISREKLSWIVDSTAAPVAGISIFSTWIAFEVSTFSAQLPAAGLTSDDGYAVFLQTIPYSFYCILTLVLVGAVVLSGRDMGSMLAAERRARSTGQVLREGATPMVGEAATEMEPAEGVVPLARRALVPLGVFLLGTLLLIAYRGGAFSMGLPRLLTVTGATQVLYDGSGSWALMMGSLAGLVAAVAMALPAIHGGQVLGAAWTTLRSMWVAFAILYLAWMIGAVCEDLGTAPYLTALIGDAVDARLLPTMLFLLAGIVAFATGSSWSTMSILLPLVVGLAYHLGLGAGLGETEAESGLAIMVMSIAAVLSGAILGDHCSPISDTTVMSSISSAADHIDHVRTQMPYSLLTMTVCIVTGYLPCAYFGLSPWIAMLLGSVVLIAVLMTRGKPVEVAAAG